MVLFYLRPSQEKVEDTHLAYPHPCSACFLYPIAHTCRIYVHKEKVLLVKTIPEIRFLL